MTAPTSRRRDPDDSLLTVVERYYDEVPRAWATAHDLGPFTLFVRASEEGWPYYARPRLGHDGDVFAEDVRRVRRRQRELGAPESFEWVAEVSPRVAAAVQEAGVEVVDHPLMALGEAVPSPALPAGVRLEVLAPDHPELAAVSAAINAAFANTDEPGPLRPTQDLRTRLKSGLLRVIGAFDETGPIGGGSHSPRGTVTELTGIGVLPRAQGRGVGAGITAALVDDARVQGVETIFLSADDQRVADIYARVGFVRIGTACIAEVPR
jgi:GNAT superfamily N-acetyltransferase